MVAGNGAADGGYHPHVGCKATGEEETVLESKGFERKVSRNSSTRPLFSIFLDVLKLIGDDGRLTLGISQFDYNEHISDLEVAIRK
jgi:hypothetical protein